MSIYVDFSQLQVDFFLLSEHSFIESKLKVGEILDFSTSLDIATLKYTYVLSTFTLKIIIYRAF